VVYEDFTTYIENDGDIDVTASTVTFTTMRRDADAYLYKDFGAGHFGDFEHLFTFRLTGAEAGDLDSREWANIHILSDATGPLSLNSNDLFGIFLMQNADVDDVVFLMLIQLENGAVVDYATSNLYTKDISRYLTIKRAGTTGTLKIYSDSARTNLLETVTITCNTTTYRYLHVVQSENLMTDPSDHISGFVSNLDLQEEPEIQIPTVTTQAATGIGETTATLHGTITDVGGESCYERGFEWGSSSGNYTQGWNEGPGPFGTGAFERTDSFTGTVYYRAYAANSAGYGYGGEQSFLCRPPAPTNVQASDGTYTDRVRITWTKSSGATDYQVYRDDVGLGWLGDVATFDDYSADAPYITPGDAVASDGTFEDFVALILQGTQVNSGTPHTYKVKARNAAGESGYSGTNNGYRGYGTLWYQWYRSAADSDASYSLINGATTASYNDAGAPTPTITPGTASASDGTYIDYVRLTLTGESANVFGRYYKCYLWADGCNPVYSGSNRGYRGVGSLTYQWQRSAADSDASYGNITGATYEPYNDTGAPENGEGRYYRCYLTATGATPQYSTSDRGYRGVATTMIGGPTAWEWGTAVAGESVVRITSDGGRTWIWGLAIGTITIPVGGPLGWEWEEVAF